MLVKKRRKKSKMYFGQPVQDAISGSEFLAGGAGFFLRRDWANGFSIQPELNFHFRMGKVRTSHIYAPDTMMTITKDVLTNFNTVTIEIPFYLKYRWELIPMRKGAYKAGSAISIFLGPRVALAPIVDQTFIFLSFIIIG